MQKESVLKKKKVHFSLEEQSQQQKKERKRNETPIRDFWSDHFLYCAHKSYSFINDNERNKTIISKQQKL